MDGETGDAKILFSEKTKVGRWVVMCAQECGRNWGYFMELSGFVFVNVLFSRAYLCMTGWRELKVRISLGGEPFLYIFV